MRDKFTYLILIISSLLAMSICSEAATVKITQSENISSIIASVGGNKKSIRITGISENGMVIVGNYNLINSKKYKNFIYFRDSKDIRDLAPIIVMSAKLTANLSVEEEYLQVSSISADGHVVAGIYQNITGSTHTPHVFRYYLDSDRYEDLGSFGVADVYVSEVHLSGNGSVLVGSFRRSNSVPTNYQAFKYSDRSGFEDLGGLGKDNAFIEGSSTDGSIIVGNFRNGNDSDHAFITQTNGALKDIASIGKYASAALVTDDGSVILGEYFGGLNPFYPQKRIFIYTKNEGLKKLGSMTFLGDSAKPLSVSADGSHFNGTYVDFLGETYTFTAKIFP